MKRLFRPFIICLFILLIVASHVFALDQGTCGDNVSYQVTGDTITFIKTNSALDAVWNNCGGIFKEEPDIKKVEINDPIKLSLGESTFNGFVYIQEMNLSKLDVSSVTNMNDMFYGCSSLTTLDVSTWDTSNVTDMSGMFEECSSLTALDVSGWDTSSVTDMSIMFEECSSLTTLDVSGWDTSSVTDMGELFYNCSALTMLDVSGWDTSGVTDMHGLFWNCSALTTLDMSGWDTSRVTHMNGMFGECSALTTLDVSGWDTSSVKLMNGMFHKCSSLTTLDVSNWDTSSATDISGVFSGCSSLTALDVSNWDTSSATNMNHMFWECSSLATLDMSNWNTSGVTDMSFMFYGCKMLSTLNVSNWDTSGVTNMSFMFYDCKMLTTLDLTGWDTSKVTNSAKMFEGSDNITKLILGEKTLSNNIFTSLPHYNDAWKYEKKGKSASNPLAIGSIKQNGTLFTAYDYDSMAGTWVVTECEQAEPQDRILQMFPIISGVNMLPATGFSSHLETILPERPKELVYTPLAMTLQIPLFEMEIELTGIPLVENHWPTEWLGEKGGILEGYALPGEGYSIIAAHNTLENTSYGPFARLSEMNENDMIFVRRANGTLIRYRVFANELIAANDFESLKQTAEREANSLILLTCENESIEGGYLNRRVIFAKPAG